MNANDITRIPQYPRQVAGALPPALLAVVWVLTLVTFNLPDRLGSSVLLDGVAIAKLAARIFACAICSLIWIRYWRTEQRRIAATALIPLAMFACWGLASVTWSPIRSISIGQLGSFVALLMASSCIAMTWRSVACTSQLLFHLTLALLVVCVAGLGAGLLLNGLSGISRSEDSLMHATMAGSTSALGLILLVAARMVWGWKWSCLIFPFGVPVFSAQLYLAHSRTAIVATLIALLLLPFFHLNRRAAATYVLIFCVGGLIYLAVDPAFRAFRPLEDNVVSFAQRDESSSIAGLSGRSEMWESMWESFQESPIKGHGYFVTSSDGELEVWGESGNWTAHNFFLQILVTTGAIGMALMLGGLLWAGSFLARYRKVNPHADQVIRTLVVLAVWFFVWGLMNESIAGPLHPECVVFFSALGLGVGIVSRYRADERLPGHLLATEQLAPKTAHAPSTH